MSKRAHIPYPQKLAAALGELQRLRHAYHTLKQKDECRFFGLGAKLPPTPEDFPYEHQKAMTADQVLSLFQWDHNILHAVEVIDAHWNLSPTFKAPHREKSKTDTAIVAKVKRVARKQQAHQAAMAAKADPEQDVERFLRRRSRWPQGRKLPSRPFPKRR